MFIGRIVHELPALLAQPGPAVRAAPSPTALASQLGTWGTVLAVVVLIAGSLLERAHRQERLERVDLRARARSEPS